MGEYERPSWDEYFMEVCEAISKRATCERGRSGCVIARDRQILVTGYVGAPAGLPHCDEVGHQFKKTIHEDGSITTHCVRTVHAEQNAICQAAKIGVSIDGATLLPHDPVQNLRHAHHQLRNKARSMPAPLP